MNNKPRFVDYINHPNFKMITELENSFKILMLAKTTELLQTKEILYINPLDSNQFVSGPYFDIVFSKDFTSTQQLISTWDE